MEKILLRSWWVLLLLLGGYVSYNRAICIKNSEISALSNKLTSMEMEKQKALNIQEDLQLRMNSGSDPAWIELMLMKKLGVVPEGQIKVCFTDNGDSKD